MIGAVAVGVGIRQLVDAHKVTFRKDHKRMEMTQAEKKIVDTLGCFGMHSFASARRERPLGSRH